MEKFDKKTFVFKAISFFQISQTIHLKQGRS